MHAPKTLPYGDRILNLAGRGRSPESLAYFDAQQGRTLEIFEGESVRVGADTAILAVFGNAVLGSVKLPLRNVHGGTPIGVGDRLWIGPLSFPGSGPVAESGWLASRSAPVPAARPARPAVGPRGRGVVGYVAPVGSWGLVIAQGSGDLLFVHRSAIADGRLVRGAWVTYRGQESDRGPTAVDVCRA